MLDPPGPGALLGGCWKSKPCPLENQPVLLSTETALQPQHPGVACFTILYKGRQSIEKSDDAASEVRARRDRVIEQGAVGMWPCWEENCSVGHWALPFAVQRIHGKSK